mmetsp:Transcript_20757/g.45197  ORF Transcript_20757/g.45197 Transcript_20757/m.45197 type:complete len:285 (-) Transcript_20757:260-1114(-)
MTVVSVGHHLYVHGTVSVADVVLSEFHALRDGQYVHAVDAQPRDGVTHLVVVADTGVTVDRGTHTVVVIFDAKDHGQIPKVAHVGRFPDLSLVGSAITVTGNGNIHRLTGLGVVLVGKGQSGADWNLCSDNTVSTEKVVLLAVHVHRSTLSLGNTVCLSKELSDDLGHGSSPHERQHVATVGGNPGVLLVQGRLDSGSNGFLSVVQVTKSTNVACLVFVVAGNFHAAHRVHGFENVDQLLLGHLGRFGRSAFKVVNLKGSANIKGVTGGHGATRCRCRFGDHSS